MVRIVCRDCEVGFEKAEDYDEHVQARHARPVDDVPHFGAP